jgi:hypothetical protein
MTKRGKRLARAVKIYLDIGWWLCIAGLVLVPIVWVWIFAQPEEPVGEAPELPILVRIYLDEDMLLPTAPTATGTESSLVRGQGELTIRTGSNVAAALTLVLAELVLFVVLYVYGELRGFFRSVVQGRPFAEENGRRIRRLGFVVVVWSVVVPVLKFIAAVPILREVHVRGLILRPPIDIELELLFVGLAILALGEIFRQASTLQRDQSLTI